MSAKVFAAQLLTSPSIRSIVRGWHGAGRVLRGRPRTLHVFLEEAEPYSELLAQAIPRLVEAYSVAAVIHPVAAPERAAAPEPERLAAYAVQDAKALAHAYALSPGAGHVAPAHAAAIADGTALRARLHHYASGMIWFEGEWYWGIDRLHHLERRLGGREDGLLFPPPAEPASAAGGEITAYLSFRSPYSYIAAMRIFDLAKRWNSDLRIKMVLPMVMRGLPVPTAKRLYIVRDAKREAERLGLRFGKICDPVGSGVERSLALLPMAREAGREADYLQSVFSGVWADGLDAASDRGLQTIVTRAGLDWGQARSCLADESWRAEIEANRDALFSLGLWGVPCFTVGDKATFGQDRLWQVGRWVNGEG